MARPPPICGRDIWLPWNSGPEPRPLYIPPPPLFTRSAGPPPDCGVKCRQLPSWVEASGRDEFPGRGTLLLNVAVPVERPVVEFAAGPAERFMPPSRCAVDESENRRHPAPSEVADLATPPFGVESVPRAGPWFCIWGRFCTALSPLENG